MRFAESHEKVATIRNLDPTHHSVWTIPLIVEEIEDLKTTRSRVGGPDVMVAVEARETLWPVIARLETFLRHTAEQAGIAWEIESDEHDCYELVMIGGDKRARVVIGEYAEFGSNTVRLVPWNGEPRTDWTGTRIVVWSDYVETV